MRTRKTELAEIQRLYTLSSHELSWIDRLATDAGLGGLIVRAYRPSDRFPTGARAWASSIRDRDHPAVLAAMLLVGDGLRDESWTECSVPLRHEHAAIAQTGAGEVVLRRARAVGRDRTHPDLPYGKISVPRLLIGWVLTGQCDLPADPAEPEQRQDDICDPLPTAAEARELVEDEAVAEVAADERVMGDSLPVSSAEYCSGEPCCCTGAEIWGGDCLADTTSPRELSFWGDQYP